MKKAVTLLLAFIVANAFWSCEKDDICPEGTPTTPSIVVEFYNKDNRSQLRNVFNLRVQAENMEGPLPAGNENNLFNGSTIDLPLRTDADVTTYLLTYNFTATGSPANTDKITFNYTRNELYVSRACGYKTLFYLNESPANGAVLEDTGDNLWIAEVVIEKPNIEDENETHIRIYF